MTPCGPGSFPYRRHRAFYGFATASWAYPRSMTSNVDITLALGLIEDETQTRAAVAIDLAGKRFEGVGLARRNPVDPNVPAVGEELATARALTDLAHRLLHEATERIEHFEG